MTLLSLGTETLAVQVAEHGTDWPGWITAVSTAAAALIVLVTAIYAGLSLLDAKHTRHGLLITEIWRQWTDPVLEKSWETFARYDSEGLLALVDKHFDPDATTRPTAQEKIDYLKLSEIANLVESLGVLVSENAITDEAVYKMWGMTVSEVWERWEDAVKRLRELSDPDSYYHFEELTTAITAIFAKRADKREAKKRPWWKRVVP